MAGKQDHLLAGKKKLEEFRKKKAAEKAKKTPSNSQLHPAGTVPHEKKSLESDPVRVTDSDRTDTSDGVGTSEGLTEPSGINKENEYITNYGSSNDRHASTAFSVNNYNVDSLDPVQSSSKSEESRRAPTEPVYVNSISNDKGTLNDHSIRWGTSVQLADGIGREHNTSYYSSSVQDSDSSSKHSDYTLGISYSSETGTHLKIAPESDSSIVSKRYGSILLHNLASSDPPPNGPSSYSSQSNGDSFLHMTDVEDAFEDVRHTNTVPAHASNQISKMGGRIFSSSVGHLTSASNPFNSNKSGSPGISFDGRGASNQVLVASSLVGSNSMRSRPSFLDSIKTSKFSSAPQIEPLNVGSFNSKVPDMEAQASSSSHDSFNAASLSNGQSLFKHDGSRHNLESTNSFYSTKQNEDFAALEQHIEDLTQEKFSLQRALEASRTLAESLASENSALTDSYNQQGSVVHQLRSDMENVQEEIKIHLVELESLKVEYTNAQLECNAADERSKLLAYEVIGLEEKALRLRSSELKLERQLENSQAEVSSLRIMMVLTSKGY